MKKTKINKIISVIFLIFLTPLLTQGQGQGIPKVLPFNTLGEFLEAVLNFIQYIGLILAVFALLAAAFKFFNAGGDPEKVKQGYQMIFWAIVGVFIIISAKVFVEFLKKF
jgi:hypothetical protein